MRKAGKRFISMLLAVIMVMGVLMAGFTNVSAATFTPRTSLPSNARSTITQYITGSGSSKNPYTAFNVGNCTWYAFGRAWEILGYRPSNLIFQGDAVVWFSKNKSNYDNGNGGFPYSTNPSAPKLGAIACFSDDRKTNGNGGHVAIVEEILSNGTIKTSESGYGSFYFQYNTRNTGAKGFGWSNYTFLGYIYLGDYSTDTTPPTISSAYATQIDSEGYTAVAIFDDNVGVTRVRFATWTVDNGQDDLIWVDGYIEAGGKSAYARVKFAEHNNEPGTYITHAYAYDAAGNNNSKEICFTRDQTSPTIVEYGIIETNSEGYTVYCCFEDNVGVTRVQFPTWTFQGGNNGQDDLIWYEGNFNPDGKSAWARVKKSEHNNELDYYVSHIYVWDAAGNCSQVATGIMIEENPPVISNVVISDITTSGYTVTCAVTDENSLNRVQFPSWHTWEDLKWLSGTVSDSKATCRVNIKDFDNQAGTYQTHIYAYDIWGNVCSIDAGKVYVPSASELYSVTYNANGGTGAPSSHSDYVNVKLSSTKPTRSGYTFLGWATSSSATTAQYQPGETISPGKSITLYAVWKQNTFTLTYNPNGGANPPANQTGNGNITLSDTKPTKSGYTFLGWATSSSATTAQYQPGAPFSLTNDTTLYAVWTPITLSSISVKSLPTKTTYTVGESFNQSGLTLTAKYSDNSTQTVTSGFTCSGFSSSTAGTKTITVTYEGKTTTFNVTVNPAPVTLTSILVKTLPTKTTYTVGESFNQSGLTLTAKYSDNSTQTVTSGFTCSGFSNTTAGTKTITVTYEGKTTTFNVTVINKDELQTKITIHNYTADKTVDYKTTITFSADVENAISGAAVHWFIDGQDKGMGDKYTVTKATKSFTVQVKYMKDGKVLAESGVEKVKVKTGFFAKLAAFFRSIFGALPKVVQGYLGVEIIEKFIPQ